MEVTTSTRPASQQPALRSWIAAPRRIGRRKYRGESRIVRVLEASYQQRSTTYGRTSGVLGFASDGRGFVAGGGGFVDTVHRGIVSVVVEDEVGRHAAQDLPAATAALEGGVLRLDCIDGHMIAVTNLSGKRDRIILLGPSAFIEGIEFTALHGALLLAALVAAGQFRSEHASAALLAAAVLGVVPGLRLWRMHLIKRRRDRLKDYMVEVMS